MLGKNGDLVTIPYRNLHQKVYFKTIEQLLIRSPNRGAQESITPQLYPHLNAQEQEQLREMELKYTDIKTNKDVLKQVLVDC